MVGFPCARPVLARTQFNLWSLLSAQVTHSFVLALLLSALYGVLVDSKGDFSASGCPLQLIIGGSIMKLNAYDLETFSNKRLIAINQASVRPLAQRHRLSGTAHAPVSAESSLCGAR